MYTADMGKMQSCGAAVFSTAPPTGSGTCRLEDIGHRDAEIKTEYGTRKSKEKKEVDQGCQATKRC